MAVKLDYPASLQRRNTIPPVGSGANHVPVRQQSSNFSLADRRNGFTNELVDWNLISIPKLSYTSLKDLLQMSPVGTPSPTAGDRCPSGGTAMCDGRDIPIRNRLVKQAAWAYLQPMAASPSNVSRNFFRRLWSRLSVGCGRNPAVSCLGFLKERVFCAFSGALRRLLEVFRQWIERNW